MQREPIDYPADALPTREDHVRTADGWTLPVTVTSPGLGSHGTVVICSALGVPRQFYAAFARALCLAGWRTVTFDYRGIGEAQASGPGTPRFADWGRQDIDAVLKWVHDTLVPEGCDGRKLVVLGHSAGGQLAGLAPHIVHADALVQVASPLANVRGWPWQGALGRLPFAWLLHVRIPLAVARVRGGMLPLADVGMGPMSIPARILGDWAALARRRGYLFAPRAGLDTRRYARLNVPLLAWGFDDDPLAPAQAIDALVARFPAARITRRQIGGAALGSKGVGHMGFFRSSFGAPWWRETVAWLDTGVRTQNAQNV
ncbi:alpha/beta hydrolase family protein [Ralstonia sp. 25C]|uniref:alpha/beta hydrolase family protein n=1 Tax=Ralstonia sp. 25C TaxID=3447363 RepID=UPI003F74EF72